MPKNLKQIATTIGFFLGAFVLSVWAQSYSWTAPTQSAPGGNTAPPINVSLSPQNKMGSLSIGKPLGGLPTEGVKLDVVGTGMFTGLNIAGNATVQSLLTAKDLKVNEKGVFLGKVGIGTDDPSSELHVEGKVKITGGDPDINKVLTASDISGNSSWKNIVEVLKDSITVEKATRTSSASWFSVVAQCPSVSSALLSCSSYISDCEEDECGNHGTKMVVVDGKPACEGWFDGSTFNRLDTETIVYATCLQ